MKIRSAIAALACILWGATDAWAQDWPAQPVKVIVPFAAGSTPDSVARLVADGLQREYGGRPFVVENKAGASGNLGTEAIAKANPDGYTIGISIGGPLAINTLLFKNLRYNPEKDIAPITQLVSQPSILAVNKNAQVTSVSELLELIGRKPGQLTYGSIGSGSLSHLTMEAISIKAGGTMVHLPFQGSPGAVTALLRNDVQLGCLPASAVVAQAQSGEIRMLAVSTGRRSAYLPDLPTLKEAGVDVEADAWVGLIAPAAMPQSIIDSLHQSVGKIIHSAEITEKLAAQFMEPVGSTPTEFRRLIAQEVTKWKSVIDAAKIQMN